jgi:large subunit ribosomal protein L18
VSIQRKLAQRSRKRALRVRKQVKLSGLPRVSVFRSSKQIYAQIIDDQQQKTLASFSSSELKEKKGDKKAIAYAVGHELAQRALKQGISKVVYDRGSFLFHGRVKSLAEGLKEGGITI